MCLCVLSMSHRQQYALSEKSKRWERARCECFLDFERMRLGMPSNNNLGASARYWLVVCKSPYKNQTAGSKDPVAVDKKTNHLG